MDFRKQGIYMGSAKTNDHDTEYTTKVADCALIEAVIAALRQT